MRGYFPSSLSFLQSAQSDAVDTDIISVPVGCDAFRFSIDNSGCYYEGDSPTHRIEWGKRTSIIKPTAKYDKLLDKYEKDLETHKLKLSEWREEKKQWKLWCEQEKAENEERRLEAARSLLRKAGELK